MPVSIFCETPTFFFCLSYFFVSTTPSSWHFQLLPTFFFISRTCTSKLKARVPMLMSYQALKSQFDWLMDRELEQPISENLQSDLLNIELFLRWVKLLVKYRYEYIQPVGWLTDRCHGSNTVPKKSCFLIIILQKMENPFKHTNLIKTLFIGISNCSPKRVSIQKSFSGKIFISMLLDLDKNSGWIDLGARPTWSTA